MNGCPERTTELLGPLGLNPDCQADATTGRAGGKHKHGASQPGNAAGLWMRMHAP